MGRKAGLIEMGAFVHINLAKGLLIVRPLVISAMLESRDDQDILGLEDGEGSSWQIRSVNILLLAERAAVGG
jgi:hypothetical protein